MKHLSDRQIQAFLDGKNHYRHARVQQHLQSCDFCRSELSAYQKVYQALDESPQLTLQPDFSMQVLNRLQATAEKRIQLWETAFVVFVGLLGLGIVLYFVNMSVFLDLAQSSALAFRLFEQSLSWIYSNRLLGVGNLETIGMVLIAILVIRLIDRFFSQMKTQGI